MATENLNFQIFGMRQQKLTTNTRQTYKPLPKSDRERGRNA